MSNEYEERVWSLLQEVRASGLDADGQIGKLLELFDETLDGIVGVDAAQERRRRVLSQRYLKMWMIGRNMPADEAIVRMIVMLRVDEELHS